MSADVALEVSIAASVPVKGQCNCTDSAVMIFAAKITTSLLSDIGA